MQATLLLRIIILLAALVAAAAASQINPPITKPNCLSHCNNISIPYPFGTDQNCYHTTDFWVTCNTTLSNTPRLFWKAVNPELEIKSISSSGQLQIMQFIAYDCWFEKPPKFIDIRLPSNFMVNTTVNKLTVLGRGANGFLSGLQNGSTYSTGCTARFQSRRDPENDPCKGLACCQKSIPPDALSVNVSVTRTYYADPECVYGFLSAESASTSKNLSDLRRNTTTFPLVVDWAIGVGTCVEANVSSPDYACKSANSRCYNPNTVIQGYRCRCEDGYDGNPYVIDGCQDIDECLLEPKKCQHYCANSVGGFKCSCRRGYRGDGRVEGEGCKRDDILIVKIVIGIASGIILLLLATWLVSVQLNRRRIRRMMKKHFIANGGMRLQQELDKLVPAPAPEVVIRMQSAHIFKIFKRSEMEDATKGFDTSNLLGEGGFGRVYRGKLSDGREVAIKEPIGVDRNQVDNFITEVVVLSQINHKNVVKLLGCCLETNFPLLVYELISHGDLSSYIHNSQRAPILDWKRRLNIAIGSASALSYLHFETCTPIIHRDIKPANILLDHNFTAKVADFGASRLVPLDQTLFATHVIGTRGYLDPEYMETRKLTTESDVYSFGVVLLGLLTDRQPINSQENFVESFLSAMQHGSLFKLVADHILSEGNKKQIIKVAELALQCLNPKGIDRPNMKKVESELKMLGIERESSSAAKKEESETIYFNC